MEIRTGVALSALIIGGVVATPTTPSMADHDDEVGWGWGADDRSMEWWFDASGAQTHDGALWGANNLSTTNLNSVKNWSWTDIRVTRHIMAPNLLGVGGCDTFWSGSPAGRCDREFVRFNNATETSLTTVQWKYLGCHEFGHAGGVFHRNPNHGTCMIPSLADYVNPDQGYYDAHDKSAINSDIGGTNQWG